MKSAMSELYETVRRAVHSDWDPIGVSDLTDQMGEYDSYVPGLCDLLSKNASEKEVFDYLWTVETESIGLQGNREATERFASWLCSAGVASCLSENTMQGNDDRERDLRVVRSLLNAVASGRFPLLAELEQDLMRLFGELSDRTRHPDLWGFLASRPDAAREGVKVTVERTLTFVTQEVEEYARRKSIRPLDEAEKAYATNTLLPLLESLEHLLRRSPNENSDASADS